METTGSEPHGWTSLVNQSFKLVSKDGNQELSEMMRAPENSPKSLATNDGTTAVSSEDVGMSGAARSTRCGSLDSGTCLGHAALQRGFVRLSVGELLAVAVHGHGMLGNGCELRSIGGL